MRGPWTNLLYRLVRRGEVGRDHLCASFRQCHCDRLAYTLGRAGDQGHSPLVRLNEAARTADATRACWLRFCLWPVCAHDTEGVICGAMLHIWNAHTRAL